MTTTLAPVKSQICLDSRGVAYIAGTKTKVISVVQNIQSTGETPEQVAEYMKHLTLGQIHAALSYYYDHREELDAYIKERSDWAEELHRQAGESPVVKRLRAEGKL
jgi:uncharacterized protein (DUF433 family)